MYFTVLVWLPVDICARHSHSGLVVEIRKLKRE